MEHLRAGRHLEPGCPEEAEIRGCSIWAVEVGGEVGGACLVMVGIDICIQLFFLECANPEVLFDSMLDFLFLLQLMKQKVLEMLRNQGDKGAGHLTVNLQYAPNSVQIDHYMWHFAKSHSKEMSHIPIHKTLTIFY